LFSLVVTAKNIVTFESRLDRLWKDQPLTLSTFRITQPDTDMNTI
jgi:hypothetical protein